MSCKTTASGRSRRRFVACAAAVASAFGLASRARAEPLRLRADALAETQGTSSPAGLVVLQGEDAVRPWVAAEGLVWSGARAGAPSVAGDVLVLTVRLREPHGYAEARGGRFVLATGAVHPVQIDGAHLIVRAPWGSTLETFGGLPVVPRFGARSYDWLAGGRVSQTIADVATLGVSYVQRREDGEISGEEVGADLAVAPARWFDVAAFGAYDLDSPGLAEARASAAARWSDWRFELFGSQLSPGRLLPATSLFSVLGDLPSQTVGATARWRAAPRLDLLASGAGQDVAGGLGGNGWLRATLRLDDRGDGNLGLEVRRVAVPGAEWTGVRAIGSAAARQRLSLLLRDRDRRPRPSGRTRRRVAVGPLGAVVAVAERLGGRRRARGVVDAAAALRGRRPRASLVCPRPPAPRHDRQRPAGANAMRTRLTLVVVLAIALAACASVLGLRHDPPSHPFEHRAHVLKGINCVECHAGVELAGETGALHLPTNADCVRCHQKPHDERSCLHCHGEPYVGQGVELAREQLRFEHTRHMAAVHGDCVRCHSDVAEAQAADALAEDGDLLRLPRAPRAVDDA